MTKIQWTDVTWSPVTGCSEVSPGCDHCYAARLARGRLRHVYSTRDAVVPRKANDPFAVRLWPERLEQPFRWKKPRMIFVCSMSDLFHRDVPRGFVYRVLNVMREAKQHTYQILTKRPARAAGIVGFEPLPPHIWIGTSIETQKYTYRVAHLANIEARTRFVSCEPLLGPLDLTPWLADGTLHWVIVGGESGPGARPMQLDWARSIVEQCKAASVPVFYKQGGTAHRCRHDSKGGCLKCIPEDLRVRQYPNVSRS